MTATRYAKVDFARLRDTAYKGVRRTAVFMGFGLNAANDPQFTRYQLSDVTPIQLMPDEVTDETVQQFKIEFARWIVACGLRELIETFSVFLDNTHQVCAIMAVSRGQMTPEYAQERQKSFLWKGFTDKMQTLSERFGVFSKQNGHLKTLHLVRNCYTHRRGIVGTADCGRGEQLELTWLGMDLYIETPEGETIDLDLPLQEGVYLEKGGRVKLRFAERKRSFPLGAVVDLSPKDLVEICAFVLWATNELSDSAEAYAKRIGIPESPEPNLHS